MRSKSFAIESNKPQLPRLVADLPRSTALAIYVPHLDLAITDVHSLASLVPSLDPNALLARVFGVEVPGVVITPAMLASIGVDAGGSAVIVPPLVGEPLIFAVELQNRPKFEAWLDQLGQGASRRVAVGGEQASVLGHDSDRPLACLARKSTAYCQFGAAQGNDPIAPLKAISGIASPSFGTVAAILRSHARLREGAHVYLYINGEPAAKSAEELALAWAEKTHRFDGRKKILERTKELAIKIRQAAETFEGAAGGLYLGTGHPVFEMDVSVSDRGGKLLRDLSHAGATQATIARWYETTALARVLLDVKADRLEDWLSSFGIDAPENAVTGTLSLLMFGVDSECSAAKREDESALGWAFLFPSALAVGLRGTGSADAIHSALVKEFEEKVPLQMDAESEKKERPIVRGSVFGSAFEARVLDEVLFFGTGPGSGAAAMRRMNALPEPSPRASRTFLRAAIHPRAIDAALEIGNISSKESRRELIALDLLRRRLRPLFQRVEAIDLSARAFESEKRIMIEAVVR
jgi:hypothetical protein